MIREVQSLKGLNSSHWPHPVQLETSLAGGNLSKGIGKSVTDVGLNPALHLFTPSPTNEGTSEREIKGTGYSWILPG